MKAFKWENVRTVPGYDGEVVPGIIASYDIMNEDLVRAGIRILMTEKEFKDLYTNFIDPDKRFIKINCLNDTLTIKYDYRGYGEFFYRDYNKENNTEIIFSLMEIGKKIEIFLLEKLYRQS
jgi:hypothetical protein